MKRLLLSVLVAFSSLLTVSAAAKLNVLMIAIDDLRPSKRVIMSAISLEATAKCGLSCRRFSVSCKADRTRLSVLRDLVESNRCQRRFRNT